MIPKNRQLHIDFRISRPDGFTWTENLASYLTRAEIALGSIESVGTESAGVDVGVRTMRFTLKNDAESFSPRDQDSAWNRHNDTYAPLLWPYREVIYKIAFTEIGATPQESDWETRFHGFLGDMIQVQENGRIVTCECRDLSKLLQDTYIESPQKYGSDQGIPAETVIQQIIDTNLGAGMVGLYCPESPGKAITEYNVEYLSVWDAIQNIAKQIGWFLGYRWNEDIGAFKLTLLEPPREKTTPDHQLDHNDDIYVQDLDVSDRDIRNAVTVTYRNKDTGQRESVTIIDQQSIDTYRRRAMQIEEDDASMIDTEAEALTLANAALADLKGLSGTTRIEMPILPTMDLFSTIQVYNPRVSSTYDFYAVESLRETYEFGRRPRFRMEAICSGRVIGGHTKWLAMQTRPGSPGQPAYPITQIPPADFRWDICEFVRDVHLRWHPVRGAKQYEIRLDENWGSADNIIYRGDALEFRFAPIQRAYTFYGAAIDEAGNYSQAVSVTISNSTPKTPPQPIITEFFSSLWIEIRPVSDNDILGYNLYVTPCDTQGNPTGDTQVTTYPTPQRITYQAEVKSSFLVQVAAFDILGEGEKCAPVLARTRTIDEVAAFAQNVTFPKIVDELPELPSDEYPADSLVVLSTDHQLYRSTGTEWDNSVSTEQLVGKITAGMIAAGAIGAAEIAAQSLVADHFAAGSIEAYIAAVQEAFIDSAKIISIEADKIKVGGSSAPIPLAIQPGDTLFRFDGSLLSTQGIKPTGYDTAERTDYGLVVGDNLCATLLPEGGVAVTEGTTNLIPTEKLRFENWSKDSGVTVTLTQNISVPEWKTTKATRIQTTGGEKRYKYWITISGSETTRTVQVKVKNIGTNTVFLSDGINTRESVLPGETKYVSYQRTATSINIEFRTDSAEKSLDFIAYQPGIKEKAYDDGTWCEGTRPAGSLSYELPISINGDWTIAKWLELEPYFMDKSRSGDKPIGKSRLSLLELGKAYYIEGYGTLGIYGAWLDSQPGKTICIMANKDTDRVYSDTITLTEAEYNNKLLVVLTKSGSMLTAYIYTVQNKYVLTCDITSLGDISQIAPQLNYHTVTASNRMYSKRHLNTLVCPYAVSAETIATWHSLDAPFYDPREITTAELAAREYAEAQAELARITAEAYADGRVTAEEQARIADAQQKLQEAKQYADQKAAEDIDASKRTIYAPGVIIDSTGAWGISGGVKQAGFGTDGKWMAGGGKVVSDAQGLRTYDKPYTDPTAVKQVEIGTDGALNFGGGAGRADSEGMILYDISDPANPKPMIRFIGKTGSADFEGVVKAKTLVVPVGTNRWG